MRLKLTNIKIKNLITTVMLIVMLIAIAITYNSFTIMRNRQNLETPEQKMMIEETSENASDENAEGQDLQDNQDIDKE